MSNARKLFCVFVAVLLCAVPVLTTAGAANGEYTVLAEGLTCDAKHIGAGTAPSSGGSTVFSYGGDGTFLFYTQLCAQEKLLYDAVSAMTPGQTALSVNIGRIENADGSGVDTIKKYVEGGVSAVFKDCPEFFWLTGSFSYGINCYNYGTYYTEVTISFTFTQNSAYPTPSTTKQLLENAVAAVSVPYGTRYDRLLALNDILRNQITYDLSAAMAYEATGALLSPYHAVCEGYSEGYKLLCDKYKIPCVLVIGTGVVSSSSSGAHMWNYVKLENGSWYAVDVTWNDQTSPYHNNYFLSGSGTYPSSAFYQVSFLSSHVPSGYFTTSQLRLFTYPTLAASAFTFPTGFYLPDDAAADDTNNRMTADGVFTVRYSGVTKALTATSYGTGTGSTFTAPTGTGGASETWTLIMRGDCTGDGSVTSSDFTAAMNAAVGVPGLLTAGSVYRAAAELTGDGVVDAADAFLVGLRTNS